MYYSCSGILLLLCRVYPVLCRCVCHLRISNKSIPCQSIKGVSGKEEASAARPFVASEDTHWTLNYYTQHPLSSRAKVKVIQPTSQANSWNENVERIVNCIQCARASQCLCLFASVVVVGVQLKYYNDRTLQKLSAAFDGVYGRGRLEIGDKRDEYLWKIKQNRDFWAKKHKKYLMRRVWF